MRAVRIMPAKPEPTDEDLIIRVAAGSQDALGPLYSRYARLVFGVAAQTLERAAAEEIMQEVFLVVWRRAELFDRTRGTFRSWLLQITHFRVLNELRRRSRQPQLAPDPEALLVANVADDGAPAADRMAEDERGAVVRAALAALPEPQRQALRLAVLESRTHEQVAGELDVPLGTAKTRIRAGLRRVRGTLLARAALLAAIGMITALAVREHALRDDLGQRDRALTVVTASDLANLRLAPAPGWPDATHARYRGRPGSTLAVVTLSSFPPAPPDRVYRVWAQWDATWVSLGTARPDAQGNGRLIVERPELATLPAAVTITLEPRAAGASPSGPVVVAWPSG